MLRDKVVVTDPLKCAPVHNSDSRSYHDSITSSWVTTRISSASINHAETENCSYSAIMGRFIMQAKCTYISGLRRLRYSEVTTLTARHHQKYNISVAQSCLERKLYGATIECTGSTQKQNTNIDTAFGEYRV